MLDDFPIWLICRFNVEKGMQRHISYLGGESLENLGLLTSAITISRRSFGDTMKSGLCRAFIGSVTWLSNGTSSRTERPVVGLLLRTRLPG